MENNHPYKLFEVTGIELEYMIVNRETLKIKPVADRLIFEKTGQFISDVENGAIAWSNELVNHVIELKTNGPAKDIAVLPAMFHKNIMEINALLVQENSMLLPTAAHPFMDPFTETMLWPHEHNEIYRLYNRIFDCRGHGWSNLQSTHINLPFQGDEEFGRLHAAIRVLLPIIPALCASSPMLDGKVSAFADTRMEAYLHNQERMPILMGRLIPEQVFSQEDYQLNIFDPIKLAMAPFDKEKIMDQHFLNSRGAIARFDRGAIEIRVIDIQECPSADLAIAKIIIETLKSLTEEKWTDVKSQKAWSEHDLFDIFYQAIKEGENAQIEQPGYLRLFGIDQKSATASHVWQHLLDQHKGKLTSEEKRTLGHVLEKGTLSSRIKRKLGTDFDLRKITDVYRELTDCLQNNQQLP